MATTKLDPTTAVVPGQLQIAVTQDHATATIAVAGEWDLAAQTAIRETINNVLALGPERVVLDLSRLSFIDSSGMQAAIELHMRAAQQNARLDVVPGPPAVQRPFEIAGLTDVLVFQSVAGA
jgi:anti-anti-sigma factor